MVLLSVAVSAAHTYPVGPPLSLDKLTADAGIIFKGTVVSSEPAEDAWFKPYPGFVVKETQFKPLFLNAMARAKPHAYLDSLARVVEEKTKPANWWGGEIPAFRSWKILFKYLQAQPPDAVRSGRLDPYLDAIEKVGNYSSGEPRDIYACYIQRGMIERAKKYREAAKKAVTYDLDYFFKQVDQNPSAYVRE